MYIAPGIPTYYANPSNLMLLAIHTYMKLPTYTPKVL